MTRNKYEVRKLSRHRSLNIWEFKAGFWVIAVLSTVAIIYMRIYDYEYNNNVIILYEIAFIIWKTIKTVVSLLLITILLTLLLLLLLLIYRVSYKVHGLIFVVRFSHEPTKRDPSRLVGFSGKRNVNCITVFLKPRNWRLLLRSVVIVVVVVIVTVTVVSSTKLLNLPKTWLNVHYNVQMKWLFSSWKQYRK